jgi:hypothetical protein
LCKIGCSSLGLHALLLVSVDLAEIHLLKLDVSQLLGDDLDLIIALDSLYDGCNLILLFLHLVGVVHIQVLDEIVCMG